MEAIVTSCQRNVMLRISRTDAPLGRRKTPEFQVVHLPRSHTKPIGTLTNPIGRRALIALSECSKFRVFNKDFFSLD